MPTHIRTLCRDDLRDLRHLYVPVELMMTLLIVVAFVVLFSQFGGGPPDGPSVQPTR